MELKIVDGHCHIFPPLAGACGFPDAATHRLHQQRAMHMHGNQPYRRLRDHAIVSERMLWDANDPSEAGRPADVAFAPGECGRMEWAVLNWNARAITFYRRLGARPRKEWVLTRLTGTALRRLARSH